MVALKVPVGAGGGGDGAGGGASTPGGGGEGDGGGRAPLAGFGTWKVAEPNEPDGSVKLWLVSPLP